MTTMSSTTLKYSRGELVKGVGTYLGASLFASVAASTDSAYAKTIMPKASVAMAEKKPRALWPPMSPYPVVVMVTTAKYTHIRYRWPGVI